MKIDSAARYGLYAEDAHADGYEDCAEPAGRAKRSAIEDLKGCLRSHIDDV